LLEELDSAGVDGGLLYAVYGPMAATTDANAEVARLLSTGKGRLLGLASLNTSDWADQGARQLGNLKTFLALPGFVGVKLANPHTCLAFDDPKMADIARVAAAAGKGVYVHTGTTPFCPNGTLGPALATPACCDAPYVDVTLLEPLIRRHVDIPWVLLHSGYDFTPAASESMTEDAIRLASIYPNVFIETAVNFADEPYPRDLPTARYPVPGGRAVLQKIRDAGVLDKALFGSDGTFILTLVWAFRLTSCFVYR
jgi:predicted TIM-barrel fold metal-dependent hydrolase